MDGKLRERLNEDLQEIMDRYPLSGDKETNPKAKKNQQAKTSSPKPKRSLEFKDKKLNKLWEKAQKAGFTDEELQSLKTEFGHHQSKIEKYEAETADEHVSGGKDNGLHEGIEDIDLDKLNDLEAELSKSDREQRLSKIDLSKYDVRVDDKHKDIAKSFAGLKAKVHRNQNTRDSELDFKESRVEELWNQALTAGFDRDELHSLKDELRHFEKKLAKLSYLNEEIQNQNEKLTRKVAGTENGKSPEHVDLENRAKQYAHKVESSEKELERRINSKHNEL